ncbi:ATP-binding protein [Undibacterium fentianense]|uniref:histidine kinase n=1 Tax=Undibacterium fentianense TaxID=2828728 RepID=A0A941E083_9BURK|nr:ATP-binding protein [Undibacterium fentianense]MBR7800799.1 GAF domain-containing protein [Undibacterium fentianense]
MWFRSRQFHHSRFIAVISFFIIALLTHNVSSAQKQAAESSTFAAGSPMPLSATLGSPIIQNFGSKIYKAHSQNWSSVQDQRGVIYFGNSSGILEFDGQRWQNVFIKGNPMVRALAKDQDDTIYYGSIGDFGYLAANPTGKVQAYSLLNRLPKNELGFNDVWQIETTSHGVYFLTRSRIFRYFQNQVTALDGQLASSQAVVLNDHLFYLDNVRGLSVIHNGAIHPLTEFSSLADGKRIVLTRFAEHQILAGKISGGFALLDLSSLWDSRSRTYRSENQRNKTNTSWIKPFPTAIDQLTHHDSLFLYRMIPIGEQGFALSTIKGGILIIDRQGQVLRAINRNAGLIDNTVAGIMLDRANNLWASTNSGISHIELSVPQTSFGPSNGIDGIVISSYFHQGNFYVGTYQHILKQQAFRYTTRLDTPQFTAILDSPGETWQFIETSGDLLAVTGRGLFKVMGDKVQRIEGPSSDGYALGVSNRWPNTVFMGKMGGIEVFQKEKGEWKFLGKIDQVRENIRRITADASGDLWLSTEVQGILRLHFTGTTPLQVGMHRIGTEHGLPDLSGNRAKFFDDKLYLLNAKGIFSAKIAPWDDSVEYTRFSPDPQFGKIYNKGDIGIFDIHPDGMGTYYLQTTDGVRALTHLPDGGFTTNAMPFRGLDTIEEPLFIHPHGSIWLPGENLFRIDLQTNKNYQEGFTALIRKVAANTKETIFDGTFGLPSKMKEGEHTVFQRQQSTKQILQLPYTQNALMFEFSASFFEKPGSLQFQYQLEGFDREWSEWSKVNSKEYTNIPEGQYRFRVRAKNIYGTLGDEASFALTILPPWYRSTWAYLLWIILAMLSLMGGVHLYTQRLRHNKKQLEHEIVLRTKEAVSQREAADKARHDIALLAEMGRHITASLEIHSIEKSLYTYVQELIECHSFSIGLVDWDHQVVRFDFVMEAEQLLKPYQRSLDNKDHPAIRCIVQAKELLINHMSATTREHDSFMPFDLDSRPSVSNTIAELPELTHPRSAIYVPMLLKQKVMGVLCVQHEDANTYMENDVAILRSLGAYAAVAFDNASSYHRLQLTQSKLVEQEKLAALGSLVAGVAHELNTPIGNSLLTASSLEEMTVSLVNEIGNGTVRRSRIEAFGENAKLACTLLMRNLATAANLITSFKQIAVDQTSDKRRLFNLNTVTTEIASTLGGRIRRDEHELSIRIPGNIEMDSFPGPYGQVITNMIINALIHAFDGRKNGEMRISAEQINESQVKIVISDNGNGITEENLTRIFDPFFTTRMGQGGSGLGLHISYNIVTAILGGSIKVKSKLDRGTIFELILPIVAPASNNDNESLH